MINKLDILSAIEMVFLSHLIEIIRSHTAIIWIMLEWRVTLAHTNKSGNPL